MFVHRLSPFSYFGVTARRPDAPVFGLMWYNADRPDALNRIHFPCVYVRLFRTSLMEFIAGLVSIWLVSPLNHAPHMTPLTLLSHLSRLHSTGFVSLCSSFPISLLPTYILDSLSLIYSHLRLFFLTKTFVMTVTKETIFSSDGGNTMVYRMVYNTFRMSFLVSTSPRSSSQTPHHTQHCMPAFPVNP